MFLLISLIISQFKFPVGSDEWGSKFLQWGGGTQDIIAATVLMFVIQL